jgi:hypothetical protein
MTVLARSKTGASRLGRHRAERPGRVAGRGAALTASVSTETEPTTPTAVKRRREAGAPTDAAMYTCGCGYVFKALVSTSVDCPHCGGSQAW